MLLHINIRISCSLPHKYEIKQSIANFMSNFIDTFQTGHFKSQVPINGDRVLIELYYSQYLQNNLLICFAQQLLYVSNFETIYPQNDELIIQKTYLPTHLIRPHLLSNLLTYPSDELISGRYLMKNLGGFAFARRGRNDSITELWWDKPNVLTR